MREKVLCCSTLDVDIFTNGFHGGDGGHGCFTQVKLDLIGSSFEIKEANDETIHFVIKGDSELEMFYQSLLFMKSALEFYEPKLKEAKKYNKLFCMK